MLGSNVEEAVESGKEKKIKGKNITVKKFGCVEMS
jgi:hypothetical protein